MHAAGLKKTSMRARLGAFDCLVLAGAGVNAVVIAWLLLYALFGR